MTTDPDRLVLLGDVKHSIPSLTRQEWAEIPGILDTIRRRIPILVFPGNHDIGIERFLREGELQPKEGAIIDRVAYLHGHTYPAPDLGSHLIVTGHHHPRSACTTRWAVPSRHRPTCGRRSMPKRSASKMMEGMSALPGLFFVPAFNEIAGYDIVKLPATRSRRSRGA